MDPVKTAADWIERVKASDPTPQEVGSLLLDRLSALHLFISCGREDHAAAVFNELVHLGQFLKEG